MQIQASILANVEFREKRKRTTKTDVRSCTIAIDVPEICGDSAPVVAWIPRVGTDGAKQDGWRRAADGGYLCPVEGHSEIPGFSRPNPRLRRKSTTLPVCAGVGISEYFLKDTFAGYSRYRQELRSIHRRLSSVIPYEGHGASHSDLHAGEVTIVASDHEMIADRYREAVPHRFAIVDGVLHRRIDDLPFAVAGYGSESTIAVDEESRSSRDYEAMVKMVPILFLRRHGKTSDLYGYRTTRKELEPEIVRPDLLPESEEDHLVRGWSRYFLQEGIKKQGGGYGLDRNGHYIAGSDQASIRQYILLRDAYLNRRPIGELTPLLQAFIEAPLSGVAGTSFSYPGGKMLDRLGLSSEPQIEGPRP